MADTKSRVNERAANALYDALSDVIQDGRTKVDVLLTKNGAPEFVSFFDDIATGYMSRLVLVCLKRLLNIEDTLSRLDRVVSKLVAAPFGTATTQLETALRLDSGVESSVPNQHIIERYRNALVSFDTARSLADDDEILLIDLCSGLICTRLPGANLEAILHLRDYLVRGGRILTSISEELWRQQAEVTKWKNYLRENPWWLPGPKRGWAKGSIVRIEKQIPSIEAAHKRLQISLYLIQGVICHLDPSIKRTVFE